MTIASRYFKARLGANWPEGRELAENGSTELLIDGPGCDARTLLTILLILHALSREVSNSVNPGRLWKIALATDYLQCHAAVEPYGQGWVEEFKGIIPRTWCEKAKNWIMISSTFRYEVFRAMNMLAQRRGEAPFDTGGLPIPKSVQDIFSDMQFILTLTLKGDIDQKRAMFLNKFLALISNHAERLREGKIICNLRCDALHYGMLMKKLAEYQGGRAPHLGYSPKSGCSDAGNWGAYSTNLRPKAEFHIMTRRISSILQAPL